MVWIASDGPGCIICVLRVLAYACMHASQRTPSLLGSDDEVCNVRSVANQ